MSCSARAQEAGIGPKSARGIGIAVDHRRRNRCVESLQANVERLKAYRSNLVVFPKKSAKPKAGEGSKDDLAAAQQVTGPIMPLTKSKPSVEYGTVTADMTVRIARVGACSPGCMCAAFKRALLRHVQRFVQRIEIDSFCSSALQPSLCGSNFLMCRRCAAPAVATLVSCVLGLAHESS